MARSKNAGPTPRFTFRLPTKLRIQLETLAEADKRELGDYIRIVLEEHVEKNSQKIAKIKNATNYHIPSARDLSLNEDPIHKAAQVEVQHARAALHKAKAVPTPPPPTPAGAG